MKGFLTSYTGLVGREFEAGQRIDEIEIPRIQRDYAQGRDSRAVAQIRDNFLAVLLDAIADNEPVSLDFVYGDIADGVFRPLDGQQRLTTLFLLHWYVASATQSLDRDAPWTRFTYATRPGARLFCERLVKNPLPEDISKPSTWIADQPWYQYLWHADPTISSMLVMLDAIHDAVRCQHPDLDLSTAWQRLTDDYAPAISFYLLPLGDMDSAEHLYITMNSRGKPLTEFENFKAIFEQDIAHSPRADEFAQKVDGAWADLLLRFDNGNDIVDDEFLRYFDFLTEICQLRDGVEARDQRQPIDLGRRARAVFGENNPRRKEHLDFLFAAFDTWRDSDDVADAFESMFSLVSDEKPQGESQGEPTRVTLFDTDDVNLLAACLRVFGNQSGTNREFSLPQTLLLDAILVHRIRSTANFPRRLRVVRNLAEASTNEIRRDVMPQLLSVVENFIVDGDLDALTGFSANQIEDEQRKAAARQRFPERVATIDQLEDHPFLRGTLTAFDTASDDFAAQAAALPTAFAAPEQWGEVMAALLATGDYQRQPKNSGRWEFGSSVAGRERFWRGLLTDATWERLAETRDVLGTFLTRFSRSGQEIGDYAQGVIDSWLAEREKEHNLDWRYYLIKYPSMRSGDSGYYFGTGADRRETERDPELGYSLAMLLRTQLNSNYRDPILLEIYQAVGNPDQLLDPWFSGWTSAPRWLRLATSAVGIRSVADGFQVAPPNLDKCRSAFDNIAAELGLRWVDIQLTQETSGQGCLLPVEQTERDGHMIDTEDRTIVGATFIRRLLDAGP